MGRPRKSIVSLEASGAFKHDPGRRRDPEPKPTGPLGPPPTHLPEAVKLAWEKLRMIAAPGILANADEWAVQWFCQLKVKADLDELSSAEVGQYGKLLAGFGMDGIRSRSKISIPPLERPNRFSELKKIPQ